MNRSQREWIRKKELSIWEMLALEHFYNTKDTTGHYPDRILKNNKTTKIYSKDYLRNSNIDDLHEALISLGKKDILIVIIHDDGSIEVSTTDDTIRDMTTIMGFTEKEGWQWDKLDNWHGGKDGADKECMAVCP